MLTIPRSTLYHILLFITASLFVLINSESTSPLFVNQNIDSQVFQYMGYSLLHGKVPYVDLFDHKGVFIFAVNALGYVINKTWGVMLLQIINLFLVLELWNKGISFVKENWQRYCIMLLSLLCLYAYYTAGNETEEWSLLFISYPITSYFILKQRGDKHFSTLTLFLIGFSIGILFNIRMNNLSPTLGVILYCLYVAIKDKDYVYIRKAFGLIAFGFLLPNIINIVYLYYIGGTDAIYAMFFATIQYNFEYKATHGGEYTLHYINFINKIVITFTLFFFVNKEKRSFIIPVIISFIITFLTIGKAETSHYLIVFIPLTLYGLGCMYNTKIGYIAFFIITFIYGKTLYRQFSPEHFMQSVPENPYHAVFDNVVSLIPGEDRNQVWNHNGSYLLADFQHAGIIQMNRILLPFQMNFSKSLLKQEGENIQKIKPKYVINIDYSSDWYNHVGTYKYSKQDREFIRNNYDTLSIGKWDDGSTLMCLIRK